MAAWNSQNNRAVWFDIPVVELDRAVAFYAAVLAVPIHKAEYGGTAFAVLHHENGNGGCLVVNAAEVSAVGALLYLNVDGRIREAVRQVESYGGRVAQPVHGIGPHGFRAVVHDCEGNRVALHSETDA